jgi:hypothetical protein
MKIVYSWLKDFVDIDVPVEELADALTGSGLEVASVEHRRAPDGSSLQGFWKRVSIRMPINFRYALWMREVRVRLQ